METLQKFSYLCLCLCVTAQVPKFLSVPEIGERDPGYSVIVGCKYNASSDLIKSAFLLINNTNHVKLSGKSIRLSPPPRATPDISRYSGLRVRKAAQSGGSNLILYQLPEKLLTTSGIYQCAFKYGNNVILSEKSKFIAFPEPKFIKQPKVKRPFKDVGDYVGIRGCTVVSNFNLTNANVYWLKNGAQRIGNKNVSVEADSRSFTLDSLEFGNSSVLDQGFYQCEVFVKGYMEKPLLSPKVHIQFQGVSTTRVMFKLQQPWHPNFADPRSAQYEEMHKSVTDEITDVMWKVYPSLKTNLLVDIELIRGGSIGVTGNIMYLSINASQRLEICEGALGRLFDQTAFTKFTVTDLKAQSLDCCKPHTFGKESFKGLYLFPTTLTNTSYNTNCKYNNFDSATSIHRTCVTDMNIGPYWDPVNLDQCHAKFNTTNDLLKLNQTKICAGGSKECKPVTEVAARLKEILFTGDIRIEEDVELIVDVVGDVAGTVNTTSKPSDLQQISSDIILSLDKLLDEPEALIGAAQLESSSSSRLMVSFDTFIENVDRVIRFNGINYTAIFSLNQTTQNIACKLMRKKFIKDLFLVATKNDQNLSWKTAEDWELAKPKRNTVGVIQIPKETFSQKWQTLYFYVFSKYSLWLSDQELRKIKDNRTQVDLLVDSSVLSPTIGFQGIENLTKPIKLTFKKNGNDSDNERYGCYYWDVKLVTSFPGIKGGWSSKGCKKSAVQKYDGYITCECDHLTNFALLLDVSQRGSKARELSIVTWIGCGISVIGLVMTIIIYLFFRELNKRLAPKILISLCASLLALLVVFLVGIERTKNRLICHTVAALLHYFMLTTFIWMAVEAVNLYRMLVTVFRKGSRSRFFTAASTVAWGCPVLVVVTTLVLAYENYGSESICMLRGLPFYISIVAPVAAIILFNASVLCVVVVLFHKQHRRKRSTFSWLVTDVRVAFMCNVLLGLTWAFGLMAVGNVTLIFEWLFCIFNSLQGAFIFIFYTIRNEDVRQSLVRTSIIQSLSQKRLLEMTVLKKKDEESELDHK